MTEGNGLNYDLSGESNYDSNTSTLRALTLRKFALGYDIWDRGTSSSI
jgi:hypothetical protein